MECRYADAEKDCSLSLELDDKYVKAYLRRATARQKLQKLEDAIHGSNLQYFSGWKSVVVFFQTMNRC